jgi:hypothetical protein
MDSFVPLLVIVVAAILAFAAGAVIARRRGYTQQREVVARCRRGHLFTTEWMSRASLRTLDLGWARIQRCPVDNHLTLVVPVKESDLTPEQKKLARKVRDSNAR